MNKGEVWRVRLPAQAGHAQAGERPAVIVQNEPFLTSLPTVLIVPFTGTLAASRFGGTCLVHPDGANGLTTTSVALAFQLSAQDKRNFVRRLGMLDAAALDRIMELVEQLTA